MRSGEIGGSHILFIPLRVLSETCLTSPLRSAADASWVAFDKGEGHPPSDLFVEDNFFVAGQTG
jgi:hypothetical protein